MHSFITRVLHLSANKFFYRLPGESAIIERMLECFAEVWIATYKGQYAVTDKDACFVLSYGIILLNGSCCGFYFLSFF